MMSGNPSRQNPSRALALFAVLLTMTAVARAQNPAQNRGGRQQVQPRPERVLEARRRAAEYKKYETATAALAQKLAGFLPAPSGGLVPRMPWDKKDFNEVLLEGSRYDLSARACQRWTFAEPVLVQRYRAGDVDRAPARSRWGWFCIEGNFGVSPFQLDENGKMETPQVGNLRGFPLYRLANSTPNNFGPTEEVWFSVLVGPPFFPPRDMTRNLSEKFKGIFVVAKLMSRADTVAADEAVFRQMLEKIDYAGLAKLLQGTEPKQP